MRCPHHKQGDLIALQIEAGGRRKVLLLKLRPWGKSAKLLEVEKNPWQQYAKQSPTAGHEFADSAMATCCWGTYSGTCQEPLWNLCRNCSALAPEPAPELPPKPPKSLLWLKTPKLRYASLLGKNWMFVYSTFCIKGRALQNLGFVPEDVVFCYRKAVNVAQKKTCQALTSSQRHKSSNPPFNFVAPE